MEDVAIVGVGCRFPGGDGLDGFWNVLIQGQDCLTDIPDERWCSQAYYDPDGDKRGKSYVKRAGFVTDHDAWDNRLFGVSDMEAASMDPQQRLAVECSYRAMENAGITRQQLKGSNTGVYIGVMSVDYQSLYTLQSETTNYTLTGVSGSNVAARVSYVFDLRGNSLVVNTACSSSMEAIHLGSQALRAGDVDLALCGGVNCLLEPGTFIQLSRARMASPTSSSKAFSANADGYARGEGCGMLLLKRYSEAVAAGDRIWAVVHTGTNQDGRTVSPMTAPSWKQQKQLFHDVFRRSGLDPTQVEYIEAHGTGTKAGDPVEARSLGEFFLEVDGAMQTEGTEGDQTMAKAGGRERWMGSVKTNIGHLESAAGVAGIIKVLLMMQHGKMVPSLHFDVPNPRIDFQGYRLNVVTQPRDWNQPMKMACVNSFSFGGTNGHALLTSVPAVKANEDQEESQPYIVCFTGSSQESLIDSVKDFAHKLEEEGHHYTLKDVAYTSCCRRDLYSWRLAVAGQTLDEVKKNALAAVSNKEDLVQTRGSVPNVVFVFCGMGTGWCGMGREMMDSYPHFRQTVQDIDTALRSYVPWSLVERLMASDDVTDPLFGPIGIFACQVALARLWQSWGVLPDAIVGQSVGEVAAACVAGVLDIPEAVKVIYHRSAVLAEARGGKMLVIGNYDVTKVEELCNRYPGRVNISLYYNPQACSISGDGDVVEEIKSHLEAIPRQKEDDVFVRQLDVTSGYHSHHMEPCQAALNELLSSVKGSDPEFPIVSSVTAQPSAPGDFSTGDYWARSVRQPSLFYQALKQALDPDRLNVCLEIGPKAVLRAHLKHFEVREAVSLPSMLDGIEKRCFLNTATRLHQLGKSLSWQDIFDFHKAQVTDIPRYAFSRVKQLVVPDDTRQKLQGNPVKCGDLRLVRTTLGHPLTEVRAFVEPDTLSSVYSHRFQGAILLPGALHVELAMETAALQDASAQYSVAVSAKFRDPVTMRKNETVALDIKTTPLPQNGSGKGVQEFVVMREDKVHAEGKMWRVEKGTSMVFDVNGIRKRCDKVFTAGQKYSRLENMGFSYGDPLKVSGTSYYNASECLMEVKTLHPELREEMHGVHIHPAILDGAFQAMVPLMSSDDSRPFLPVGVGAVVLRRPVSEGCYVYCYKGEHSEAVALHQAFLLDSQGHVVMEVHDFAVQFLGIESVERMAFLPGWKLEEHRAVQLESSEEENFWRTTVFVTDNASSVPNVISPRLLSNEEALRKEFKSKISPNHTRVVFLAADVTSSAKVSTGSVDQGQALYDKAVAYCDTLRVLVSTLGAQSRKLPVFVVSHNAWSTNIPQDKTSAAAEETCDNKETADSLAGAALWGMVRNILREDVYSFLRLVDLHVPAPDAISCLPSAIRSAEIPPLDEVPEMTWSKNEVMANVVTRLDVMALQTHRRQAWDEKTQAVLEFSKTAKGESFFLNVVPKKLTVDTTVVDTPVPKKVVESKWTNHTESKHINEIFEFNGNSRKVQQGNNTSLKVKNGLSFVDLCLHGAAIPTSLSQDPLAMDHVPGSASEPVTAFEVSGVTKDGEKMIAAWPVDVGTQVSVPEACCLHRSLLPNYRPGTLSHLLLLQALSSRCGSRPGIVGVLADGHASSDAALMVSMLKTRDGVSSVHLISAENDAAVNGMSQCRVMVSLVRLCPVLAAKLAKHALAMTELVIHEALLPTQSLSLFCKTTPHLKINQVFSLEQKSPAFLTEAVPALTRWLKSCKSDTLGQTLSKMEPLNGTSRSSDDFSQNASIPSYIGGVNTVRGLTLGEVEVRAGKDCLLRKKGVYVVVGGLTGLGWECVRHLARRGAGGLVLLGRRKADENRLKDLASMEREHGCRAVCVQADVCQLSSLQAALKQIKFSFPGWPIKGMFFGAAVLDNALFEQMTPEQYRYVLRPKVVGLWNVHQVMLGEPLDYFVVHTSVTGILGNVGQTNYAAANTFQDALIAWRRSQGLAATALSWGPLLLGLMVGQEAAPRILEAQGISFFSMDDLEECLDLALMREEHQLMLLKMDRDRFATVLYDEDQKKLIRRLHSVLGNRSLQHGQESSSQGSEVELDVKAVMSLPKSERLEALQKYLLAVVGNVFGVDAAGLTPDTCVFDLGVDSMLAMAMVNRVAKDTHCRLSVMSLLQQDSSLRRLAAELETLLSKSGEGEEGLTKEGHDESSDKPFEEDPTLLSAYELRQYYSAVSVKLDLQFTGLLRFISSEGLVETLREAAKTSLSRHPLLHTGFLETDDGPGKSKIIRRKEIPVEDSMDWRVLGEKEQDKLTAWTEEPLLLSKGPVRFLMQGGPEPKLRLILSCVTFDLVTTMLYLADFRQLGYALARKQPLPPPPYSPSVSTKTEIERALHPIRPRMKAFWKTVVSRPVPKVTLADLKFQGEMTSDRIQLDGAPLSPNLVSVLQMVASGLGASLYQTLVAAYHVLLSLASGHLTTSVAIYTSARASLPSLARALGNTTNVVPVVATIDAKDSLAAVIRRVATEVQSSLDYAIFPTLELKDLISDKDQQSSLFRHGLVEVEIDDQRMKDVPSTGYGHQGGRLETVLGVVLTQDSNTTGGNSRSGQLGLRLTLGYQRQLISEKRANALLSGYQCLLEDLAYSSEEAVSNLAGRPYIKALSKP